MAALVARTKPVVQAVPPSTPEEEDLVSVEVEAVEAVPSGRCSPPKDDAKPQSPADEIPRTQPQRAVLFASPTRGSPASNLRVSNESTTPAPSIELSAGASAGPANLEAQTPAEPASGSGSAFGSGSGAVAGDVSPSQAPALRAPLRSEGDGQGENMGAYLGLVRARIAAVMRFPDDLGRAEAGGLVVLRMLVDADGRVREVRVVGGDASESVQSVAVEGARKAGPFPPLPRVAAEGGQAALEVPLRFSRKK